MTPRAEVDLRVVADAGSRGRHEHGWVGCLDNLEAHVQRSTLHQQR
jgi:hypothetical protein